MNYFWLDANAIAKRSGKEKGTPIINYFFTNISPERMICLCDSVDETFAVIVKYRYSGAITPSEFNQVIQKFEVEVINNPGVLKVNATVDQKIAARKFIDNYSVSSTEAYSLRCALDTAEELKTAGDVLILVSSDKRLLRAARSEGLRLFNPETDSQTTLDVLINS